MMKSYLREAELHLRFPMWDVDFELTLRVGLAFPLLCTLYFKNISNTWGRTLIVTESE